MPIVDYADSSIAQTYAGGRALDRDVLDGWRHAVGPFLPVRAGGCRVLDLGAGTGIFTRAWPSWTPCDLVALEPSAAMRAEMAAIGLPEDAPSSPVGARTCPYEPAPST
jgi:ubiquinone/menaquinone biosynthesis C-methylase UbiE